MTAASTGSPRGLGPDWVPGLDGMPFRRAARVILVDASDRVLLMRGHDVDEPSRTWWFTIGGGIDAGEDARSAAVRELREETGLELDVASLVGPVVTRSAVFDFFAVTCRQDEQIFLARLDAHGTHEDSLSRDGWTEVERRILDELRWWPLDALADVTEEVYPEGLVDLVRDLLAGWDGVTRHLGTQEPADR
ncbi:RNA pyrophosphohydrolase [mine drainage metagenome]|uniref:RNA pyrophosphohydrolase n=1 Tax=mine drainage metagenome TaxID=410659 RepID=A0A1J5RAQ8_9ZZZZ